MEIGMWPIRGPKVRNLSQAFSLVEPEKAGFIRKHYPSDLND